MNLADQLSEHITYGEAIHSNSAIRLGIDNIPNDTHIAAMKYVASEIFDKIRDWLQQPLFATSFFRNPQVNATDHGAKDSQHLKGEAIDHYLPGHHADIFKWVWGNLEFDQMIWEFGDKNEPAWVHISKVNYRTNRNEVLRAYLDSYGNTQYVHFDLFAKP